MSVWDGYIIPHDRNDSPTNKVFATLWYMKKNAYAESTIRAVGQRLKHIAKHCNLNSPELVKGFIAQKNCSNAFKESLVEAFDLYCRAHKIEWSKPFYQRYDKLPKIPSEEKLNMIISSASRKYALILSIMKDLGTRPIELAWLKTKDIDLEKRTVNITIAKHCVGRTLKLKTNTTKMLTAYINKKDLNLNDRIFPTKSQTISEKYRILRNRLAKKLKEPAIQTIRLYDFRHWFATTEYHKTKDLLHVKKLLGHKDLRTTLRYTQLLDTLENDQYHCKTANNIKEATNLIENGFQYVTDIDGTKLFRKPK